MEFATDSSFFEEMIYGSTAISGSGATNSTNYHELICGIRGSKTNIFQQISTFNLGP